MPNTHETLTSLFSDIADSIRTKTGKSATIVADNFPTEIDSIVTDPSGSTTAVADDLLLGKTAYSKGAKITGTIVTKTASDLTASDDTVTVPAGYYAAAVSKAVDGGSATTPATTITTNPTVSWDSTNKKIKANYSGSQSVTPTVSAGYVSTGTAGTISTEGTTSVTAESLDANLAASNIKAGTTIFNTTGTFTSDATATTKDILTGKSAYVNGAKVEGTITPREAVTSTITTQGGSVTISGGFYDEDSTVTANITASVLDNSIISGQAYEEATGDYAWRSTVTVPAGYHNSQTLTKDFSEIFPAPETPATATEMLLGYQAFNKSGQLMTGTMANNGATTGTISTQGGTFTIPAGYHNGEGVITASLPSGTVNAPTAAKGTVSNNSITVTPSVTSSTGYITGSTISGAAVTVSASELVSGNKELTPSTSVQTGIDVTNYATVSISAAAPNPETVSTVAELEAKYTAENEGKLYKYTGTTIGSYVNGDIYEIYNEPFTGLTLTANTAGSTVTLGQTGSAPWSGYYSTDSGANWHEYTIGTEVTLTNAGDTVSFKGEYSEAPTPSNCLEFSMTGSIASSGNIMSLCSGDNFASVTTIPYNYCFYYLFNNCTSLTSAPSLPATTLATSCYSSMFCDCTSLTETPELPATTLAVQCYYGMFTNCTSISTTHNLPATTLTNGCYYFMFAGCTSLTSAPALPATTLTNSCYCSMFSSCTSLTTAPALPATTLAQSCYFGMFMRCTSLTTAPALPATTLADSCYQEMFNSCTSLTTPPDLFATTCADDCYRNMFDSCSSLKISVSSGTLFFTYPSSADESWGLMMFHGTGLYQGDPPYFGPYPGYSYYYC